MMSDKSQTINQSVNVSTLVSKAEATVSGFNTTANDIKVVKNNKRNSNNRRDTYICSCCKAKRVPAPRLVGVEPNPGPNPPKRNGQSKPQGMPKPKNNKMSQGVARAYPQYPVSQKRQVSVAAAYATGQTTRNARVSRTGTDSTRIIHRELVGSVLGTVAYTVGSTIAINPGLPNSFPWLSTQALGWEKYKFNYLRLCYYTRTGSNTPGSVILVPDYDAQDSAPANEQIASAYHGTQEDVAWKDNCLTFEPKVLCQERFIRTGGLAANQDIKTYDIANAFVATLDGTAVNWGKVWLEYDVTLINQQLNSSGPSGSGTIVAGGAAISITAATPFGTTPVTLGSYNLTGSGTNVLSFSGLSIGTEYAFVSASVGTVMSLCAFNTPVGLTLKTAFNHQVNAAATQIMTMSTFTATANFGTVTLGITATTVTATDLIVTALNSTPSF
jgi:hypothetical protein